MLPTPTIDLVQQECDAFDDDTFTKLGEDALAQLIARFPHNTDPAQVLLKVLALDQLYSTRIHYVDLVPFAQHIADHHIDQMMQQGSLSAVEQIWNC